MFDLSKQNGSSILGTTKHVLQKGLAFRWKRLQFLNVCPKRFERRVEVVGIGGHGIAQRRFQSVDQQREAVVPKGTLQNVAEVFVERAFVPGSEKTK